MFVFILILHSFQLIFMDSAVCKESFSFISVFCIFFFIHSRRSYIIFAFLFRISLFAFPLPFFSLAFSFCNSLLLQ